MVLNASLFLRLYVDTKGNIFRVEVLLNSTFLNVFMLLDFERFISSFCVESGSVCSGIRFEVHVILIL